MQALGVYGGTFDPIHYGHLRVALEAQLHLNLEKLLLIPCGHPPHRVEPHTSKEHRLAMAKLALAPMDAPILLDKREIHNTNPSYTVNTLEAIKGELFNQSICLIIGSDAFYGLCQWHQWQKLAELAHLVVVPRPVDLIPKEGVLQQETVFNRVYDPHVLHDLTSGCLYWQPVTPLSISSTQIRADLRSNKNPQFLLPDSVLAYIKDHKLYYGDDGTYV